MDLALTSLQKGGAKSRTEALKVEKQLEMHANRIAMSIADSKHCKHCKHCKHRKLKLMDGGHRPVARV